MNPYTYNNLVDIYDLSNHVKNLSYNDLENISRENFISGLSGNTRLRAIAFYEKLYTHKPKMMTIVVRGIRFTTPQGISVLEFIRGGKCHPRLMSDNFISHNCQVTCNGNIRTLDSIITDGSGYWKVIYGPDAYVTFIA